MYDHFVKKRVFFFNAGFEKLKFCVHENQTQINFDLIIHKSKAKNLSTSKYKFNAINFLHNSR